MAKFIRRPLGEPKLQGQSLPDIVEGMRRAVTELAGAGIRHGPDDEPVLPGAKKPRKDSRKIKLGPLLSALAVWYLDLDPGERRTIARAALKALHDLENKPPYDGWKFIPFGGKCEELPVIVGVDQSVQDDTRKAAFKKAALASGMLSDVDDAEELDSLDQASGDPAMLNKKRTGQR